MSDPVRLAVLGGSGVATPELVDALLRADERLAMHLSLIGREEGKLAAVGKMAQRLAEKSSPPITISMHTDVREGLAGAQYILNQVRVGGYAGRMVDETLPHQFGIPGEETVGPGGMNMALRTIPVVVE
jgi:6-phospho-beta-glucosidase